VDKIADRLADGIEIDDTKPFPNEEEAGEKPM
jgi:hypothetical protein